MNRDKTISITNRVSILASIALLYWVILFIVITVFDLKVFREKMTEVFYLSILGIMALLVAGTILNVMLNLSKIADQIGLSESNANSRSGFKHLYLFYGTLLALIGLLFIGDKISSIKKRNLMKQQAFTIKNESASKLKVIEDYQFDSKFVENIGGLMDRVEKQESDFSRVGVVILDTIQGDTVFLVFDSYASTKKMERKENFIFKTGSKNREYLRNVFQSNTDIERFSEGEQKEEYFLPVSGKRRYVLYLSNYSGRYGKIGS